jgi:hypothetical protein
MRSRTLLWLACLAAALLVLNGGQYLPADPPKENKAADQPPPAKNNERWQVGMKWVVETTTDLAQLGDVKDKKPKAEPIQWQFSVLKPEKVHGHDCYRLEVERLIDGKTDPKMPMTTVWADAQSLALRQIRTEFVVQGQTREVTESYEFEDGQPAPVMSPLTSIPLDFPLMRAGTAKGNGKFSYAAISGPGGKKALGDVGFAVEINQDITEAKPDAIKGLVGEDFSKDLGAKPITEVNLSTGDRSVRQLWKGDMPWPVYSNNGTTTSKLIKVTPPTK